MKKRVALVVLLGICLLGVQELQAEKSEDRGPHSSRVTVEDFRGVEISLDQPARRIVCLIESALSGLFMLGVQDRVVGISTNVYQSDVFGYYAAMDERIAARSLPAPGNWDFVNVEGLMALKPDLVVIWSHQEESIRAMESRGIPVFGVFIHSFEDIYREMLALGELTGSLPRARQLVAFTQNELARLRTKTSGVTHRPRVYYMWAQGELETSGRNSTVHELITLAGGENVSGSIQQEHLVVNMEKVLEWNPEVIVMWHNERKDPEDILKNPRWRSVQAVKSGRVHEFPDVFSCDLWTLKFLHAVRLVAAWCHPEVLSAVDMEEEKSKLFQYLYGEKITPSPGGGGAR